MVQPVQDGVLNQVLEAGQARVVLTYNGHTGDLPDPVNADTTADDVRRMAEEALRTGGIRGIEAMPDATLRDFIVDRAEPNEVHPYPRLLVRPKTAFGHQGHGHEKKEHSVTFRPLGDKVLIKRGKAEEKSPGGIIIPDVSQTKPMECKVEAVGRGKVQPNGRVLEPSVKKGDRVLIGKYSGTEVKVNGEEMVIITEDEILGVIED